MLNKQKQIIAFTICVLLIIILYPTSAVRADSYGFTLTAGGGLCYFGQESINEYYIDGFAKPVGLLDDNLNSGYMLFAEYGYPLIDRMTLHLGISYSRGNTSHDFQVMNVTAPGHTSNSDVITYKLTTWLFAPHIRAKYQVFQSNPAVFISGGLLYGFGRAIQETEMDYDTLRVDGSSLKNEYSANGFGFMASIGVEKELSSKFSSAIEFGYRYLKTGG